MIIEEIRDVSPHNQALYEAGKVLLIQSVEVGREFCKFMTTTALAAIPTYIGLLKLVLPQDHSLQNGSEAILLIPPAFFFGASIVFMLGYFPKKGNLSLDIPAEIERERKATITRRYRYAICGFVVFGVGTAIASVLLIRPLIV
jgi:hypothetical protein